MNNNDKVIAFHRWDQGGAGDDVVIIANFSNQSWTNYQIGLPRGGQWNVLFNSDWNGYSADFGNTFTANATAVNVPRDGLNFSAGFDIGPYTTVILSQPSSSAPQKISPAKIGPPMMGKPIKN
ncbi:MAG: alpha amylase C-terminal domain-containing protein [Fimbriimonadaceae bacterium]